MGCAMDRGEAPMTGWNTYTDFLFDERRFPVVFVIAAAIVVIGVLGTAFGF